MDLVVTSGVIATLREEAARAHPAECCGLLLGGGGRIVRAVPTANVHADPRAHFEIDPAALIAAHRAAREGGDPVAGYYHSHPNGLPRPSATDAAMASGDGRVWAIVSGGGAEAGRAEGDITFWRDDHKGFERLSTSIAEG